MNHLFLWPEISLTLFDGGAADGGAADATTPIENSGMQAGPQDTPGSSRRAKTSGGKGQESHSDNLENILFGKQEEQQAEKGLADSVAGNPKDVAAPEEGKPIETQKEKRAKFKELVNGEFKDIYTAEMDRIIKRRFRETKEIQEKLEAQQPVLDTLMARYRIADGDIAKLQNALDQDDALWAEQADEAGMSIEQYKAFRKMQRENMALRAAQAAQEREQKAAQQVQGWLKEAEEMRGDYPDFDLAAESNSSEFLSMLKSGVPVRVAYEVLHLGDIKVDIARNAAKQAEKNVVDGIRAKGSRPAENGVSSQNAFTVKEDPSRWTKAEMEEVERRVRRGETIRL